MGDQEVRCGSCNILLEEKFGLLPEKRKPCPKCGSMMRALSINIVVTAKAHESLAFRHKDQVGKTLAEGKSGDEFYRKKGEWRTIERTIDHAKNWYKKIIRDAKTGKILYQQEEPLDQHLGHGSDRTFKNRLKRRYKRFINFIGIR